MALLCYWSGWCAICCIDCNKGTVCITIIWRSCFCYSTDSTLLLSNQHTSPHPLYAPLDPPHRQHSSQHLTLKFHSCSAHHLHGKYKERKKSDFSTTEVARKQEQACLHPSVPKLKNPANRNTDSDFTSWKILHMLRERLPVRRHN